MDSRQTFQGYSKYFLETKRREGLKKSTCERYLLLLQRINPAIGHMKLQDIRPQHLNLFYKNLMEEDIRQQPATAQAKAKFSVVMKAQGISQAALAKQSKVAASTIQKVRDGGTIQADKANAIAKVLGTPADQLFIFYTNKKPLAPKTVLEHHRLVRTILGLAEKELIVPYNAASKATPPKVRRPAVNTFQPNEIAAILDSLEKEPIKWRTLVHLMIVTGCRRGEIMGLKWENVNLERGVIHICETLLALDSGASSDTPKTEESQRYINIPRETVDLLQQYLCQQDCTKTAVGDQWQETGYVFTQNNGKPMHPDSVNGWLNQFSQRHGLRHINPHAFRHSMASILINNGTDILSVSQRLGHTMTSTTLNIYGHILQQADAQSSECIADVLLRNQTDPSQK